MKALIIFSVLAVCLWRWTMTGEPLFGTMREDYDCDYN